MHLPTIICVGGWHIARTYCLGEDGIVRYFGTSLENVKEHDITPKVIQSLPSIKRIACGENHVICLDKNGNVFSFGDNTYGELGLGKGKDILSYTSTPQKVSLPAIQNVYCTASSTICVSEDNELFSFGYNDSGQLGHGDYINIASPKKIEAIKDVDFLGCGSSQVICKTLDNKIYAWGSNSRGQLGLGTVSHSSILMGYHEKRYNLPQLCINWPEDVVDIKCGSTHTLILTDTYKVFSFGDNEDGQLGRSSYSSLVLQIEDLPDIRRIECGVFHSICIDFNDNMFVFGENIFGQLGLTDISRKRKPFQHPTLSNIVDFSSGGNHTFAKTSNNQIYAFGNNTCLQLGIHTDKKKQLIPIQVLEGMENIWFSDIKRFKVKSAMSVHERPKVDSPPKQKRKYQ